MPTIAEIYSPLVEAAQNGDSNGHLLLKETGKSIFESNPTQCHSVEDGIEAAKRNLDYYCQYFSPSIALKVKEFYGLNSGFRTLVGKKIAFA